MPHVAARAAAIQESEVFIESSPEHSYTLSERTLLERSNGLFVSRLEDCESPSNVGLGGMSVPADMGQFELEGLQLGRKVAAEGAGHDLLTNAIAGLEQIVNVDRDSLDRLRLIAGIPNPILQVLAHTPVFGDHGVGAAFVRIGAESVVHPLDCA